MKRDSGTSKPQSGAKKPRTGPGVTARTALSIADIGAEAWQGCAGGKNPADANPFISYAFLEALETSGCVGPGGTGWIPQHISLHDELGSVIACAPCYAKLHSRGEYVFDHAWAEAFHRCGQQYYPKLQVAVPFTPVPGLRLLVRPDQELQQTQGLLASALAALTDRMEASSAHITFLDEATWNHLGDLGYLKRMDQQFHWQNQGYKNFDDFLATLTSRKRKTVRKERRQARDSGLTFKTLRGDDISEADWDRFFAFYLDTGSRKWGDPYLNRAFFSELGAKLSQTCVLTVASDGASDVAAALHIIGGGCLYGRYWGCTAYHPFLHFELCYYQAMDFAIEHGLHRAEAGAQGEHKLLRGYMPTPTYSAHWISDENLRAAIARHLQGERRDVRHSIDVLASYGPYKSGTPETK